jgi:PEGA domain
MPASRKMSIWRRSLGPLLILLGVAGWVSGDSTSLLRVISQPSQAEVYLNSQYCGTTPCQVQARTGDHLRLEKTGFLTTAEYLRFADPSDHELSVRLRPGITTQQKTSPATYYPPSLGKPPFTRFLSKPERLGGYAYAVPPQWTSSTSPHQPGLVDLSAGDGQRQPLRNATLQIVDQADLEDYWTSVHLAKEEEGWTLVAHQRGAHHAWIRLERPRDLGLSRAAVVLQKNGDDVVRLDYTFESCYDPFLYTRDLDFLRSCLGFNW